MPAIESPLVNEYKGGFIKRRLLETFLGGLRLRFSYHVPKYIHLNQLCLFIFPGLMAGIFTSLVEEKVITLEASLCYLGPIMFIFTLSFQILSWKKQQKSVAITPIKRKTIHLGEEDEIEFSGCCSSEAIKFVIPLKKYKLNVIIHALVSGAMCALSFHYLETSVLLKLFGNYAAAYLLATFGWITVIIAQYSLTTCAPPEPAIFHPLDSLEIASLMRPFYVISASLLHIYCWYSNSWNYLNCFVHIVFVFLPLLWFLGALPPLDALLPWLGEQLHLWIFGGSPMASNFRLISMLIFSLGATLLIYFTETWESSVITAACTGYILSLDICGLCSGIYSRYRNRKKLKYSTYDCQKSHSNLQLEIYPNSKTVSWRWSSFIFHLIILGTVALTVAVILINPIQRIDNSSLQSVFGYLLLSCLFMNCIFNSLQQVYCFGGLFVNPFYSKDYNKKCNSSCNKRFLNSIGQVRCIIMLIGSPFLLISYFSLFDVPRENNFNSTAANLTETKIVYSVTSIRCFRWAWQDSENALLELVVVHFINYWKPACKFTELRLSMQLLLAAFFHNRLNQLLHKLHVVIILSLSSLILDKQKQHYSGIIIMMNILFLPFLIILIMVSCIISAPLLPLFTLPIFLLGFPRPLRSWPGQVGKSSSSSVDSVYYKQIAPILAEEYFKAIIVGSLGTVTPGDHFLARYEDRLILILILEKGYGFYTMSIKGLELQETSCHAVEATNLDALLTAAFENSATSDRILRCLNPEPFHVFFPRTTIVLPTYSDTRNVLTGLIDSPEVIQRITKSFVKTLLWVLMHYCANKHKKNPLDGTKTLEKVNDIRPVSPVTSCPRTANGLRKLPKAKRPEECIEDTRTVNSYTDIHPTTEMELKDQPRSSSLHSIDNHWSDDEEDPLGEDHVSSNKTVAVLLNRPDPISRPPTTLFTTHIPGTVGDSLLPEMDFGMPAVDISKANDNRTFTEKHKNYTIIGNPMKYSNEALKLSPPFQWLELPFDQRELVALRAHFPIKWYNFVLKIIATKLLHIQEIGFHELEEDEILLKVFRELVLTCHSIVNLVNLTNSSHLHLTPSHIYKSFSGEIAWSPFVDWLNHNDELLNLVVQAYGYATKLSLDQFLLGEDGTNEEVAEYLTDYDSNWFIGSDSTPAWGENILKGKPNLFSLGFNPVQGTYTSHLLTLQDLPVHIGSLNPEMVRGLWASLNYELLYLTNDDEERYSIQAHPVIIRNLIIQAADPPLGYPIYASEPFTVRISTLWKRTFHF